MLHLATHQDLPVLLEMTKKFHQHSPYSDQEYDEPQVTNLINTFLTGDRNERLIIMYGSVGMLAAMTTPMLFNSAKISTDVMWWVDPPSRGKAGPELLRAYEYWAKLVGCRYIQTALLETEQSDRIEKLYTRRGYKRLERAYLKEV